MSETYLTNINAQTMAQAHGYKSSRHAFCPWINLEPSDRVVGLVGCGALIDHELGEVYNIVEAIALVQARVQAVCSYYRPVWWLSNAGNKSLTHQADCCASLVLLWQPRCYRPDVVRHVQPGGDLGAEHMMQFLPVKKLLAVRLAQVRTGLPLHCLSSLHQP
jgi:hypothetical protein